MVDDHNAFHHMVPSIEGRWTTDRWANGVFAYLLATSEINGYLAMRHWVCNGAVEAARTRCRVAHVATLCAAPAALRDDENARTVGQAADARDLWLGVRPPALEATEGN